MLGVPFRVSIHGVFVALLATGLASCSDSGAGAGECSPTDPTSCPPGNGFAQFCSALAHNVCINVCSHASLVGGCEVDSNCASPLTCDNDRVGASSCECVLACPEVDARPGSVPDGGSCSVTADCVEGLSCDNERVGLSSCTCQGPNGGGGDEQCDPCIGVNAAPEGDTPDRATSCEPESEFSCSCRTESGETRTFSVSGDECFF